MNSFFCAVKITPPTLSDKKFRRKKKKDDDDDWELVPPDGGWGWLILFGSTLVNLLIPGMIKSFGVLFGEFQEAFNASQSSTAWIAALCYFLYSSLGMCRLSLTLCAVKFITYSSINIACRSIVEHSIGQVLLSNCDVAGRNFCCRWNDVVVFRMVNSLSIH